MTKLFILGATGDLTSRKIIPALNNLLEKEQIPVETEIVAVSRRPYSTSEYLEFLSAAKVKVNDALRQGLKYVAADFSKSDSLQELRAEFTGVELAIVYFAVEPQLFPTVVTALKTGIFTQGVDPKIARIVVEKPFGLDHKSASELSELLEECFTEQQIYRVDHVLNRQALSDIMELKRSNFLVSELFSNKLLDFVQVTYAEELGIEGRGAFYEATGALRDMVQSHLLQALGIILSPGYFTAQAMEDFQMARARAISQLEYSGPESLVLGQYQGYLQEPEVSPTSKVETFAALKLESTDPNWQGVPIFLRTGKKLKGKYIDIHLVCKLNPQQTNRNVLTFRITPNSGINLRLWKPEKSAEWDLEEIDMSHCYRPGAHMEPYEQLLANVFVGDRMLFVSKDEVLTAWQLIDKIKADAPEPETYQPGGMGPAVAEKLMERAGFEWLEDEYFNFCRM
jgi:glucose-6-phosphate 1-dehydrogenase